MKLKKLLPLPVFLGIFLTGYNLTTPSADDSTVDLTNLTLVEEATPAAVVADLNLRERGWRERGWRERGWRERGWRRGWRHRGWRERGWRERGWRERGWRWGGGLNTTRTMFNVPSPKMINPAQA